MGRGFASAERRDVRHFVIPFLCAEAFQLAGKWWPGLWIFPFSGQKIAALRHTFSGFAAR